MNRFKTEQMRKAYDAAMKNYEFGVYGTPKNKNRGAGNRCAFWDGYSGMPNKKYPIDSNSYANFRAGQDVARKYQPSNGRKNMNELIEKIKESMGRFNQDAHAAAVKGNKAAGARSRKESLVLATLLKEWRQVSIINLTDGGQNDER